MILPTTSQHRTTADISSVYRIAAPRMRSGLEALEQALQRYPGTVIIVSHDRFFLDALGPAVAKLNLEIGE